jgi:hypothetical protein
MNIALGGGMEAVADSAAVGSAAADSGVVGSAVAEGSEAVGAAAVGSEAAADSEAVVAGVVQQDMLHELWLHHHSQPSWCFLAQSDNTSHH